MSRHRTPILLAAVAALAVALSGCGTESAADIGAPVSQSGWITAEQMAATTVEQGTVWLTAAFLPADADGEVDPADLEVRYYAWAPPAGQDDYEPAAEAFRILGQADPQGAHNALAGLDLTMFNFPGMDDPEATTITVDFGEGLAKTRSMSSAEALAAFSQLKGTLMLNYPRAEQAKVTVEGQGDPELFGGIDTTEPFAIR